MKRILPALTALLLMIVLASCTSLKVRMGEKADFRLLPLDSVGEPLDSYQLVTGTFPGFDEGIALEAWLVWDDVSLDMMLFAPTGQTMGKVVYDGNDISFESAFIPEYRVVGLYMVADMQLCFAGSDALDAALSESGMELEEKRVDDVLVSRCVYEDGRQVYGITYDGPVITVSNLLRGYSYSIELL
jgi:hypothetical protein